MNDAKGNPLKIGDWVLVIADGHKGDCGRIHEITKAVGCDYLGIDFMGDKNFGKYPHNVVHITEEEAMICLLEK